MADAIYPSELAVGLLFGSKTVVAREQSEAKHQDLRGRSSLQAFVSSGLTLSAGSGLDVNVAPGEAIINGYLIVTDATKNVSGLTANRSLSQNAWTPNFIWIRLDRNITSGLVQGLLLTSNTSGTAPTSESLLLGVVATNATNVTAVAATQASPTIHSGSYTGAGAPGTASFIFCGFTPKKVEVFGKIYHDNSPGNHKFGVALSPASSGRGFTDVANTLAPGVSTSDVDLPLITTLGFSVKHVEDTPDVGDKRGLNNTGEVYDWFAWA